MDDKEERKSGFRENLERQYIFFTNSFSVLAITALLTFSFVNVVRQDIFLGIVEFTIATILIVNLILLWITKNVKLCTFLLLAGVFVVLLILFITGGIGKTGIYWFFTFPPAAFFLVGRKNAVIWLVLLYSSTIIVTLLSQFHYLTIPYTIIEIRQLLIAHIVISATLFIYENTRVTFENELESNRKALAKQVSEEHK